jgi:hypothetical protein
MLRRYLWIFLVGCSSSSSNDFHRDGMLQFSDQDLSVPEDLRAPEDLTAAVEDLSLLPEDLQAATRPDLAGGGGCTIKVNELLLSTFKGTTSRPSEEYVELYNPCATSKNLKNWSIRYRSASNNTKASYPDTQLVQDIAKTIPAMGYLLFGGSQYSGSKDGSLINGMADDGGGVAIVDPNEVIIDSVAYGSAVATHNFLEGSAAPLPPQSPQPGKVIARSPNGSDTDDNSADFKVQDPTPKAANN